MSLGSGSGMHIDDLDVAELAELAAATISRMRCRDRVVPVVERLHHDEAGSRRRLPATVSASVAFAVNGFSQSTCFPAASARSVHTPCSPLGSGL